MRGECDDSLYLIQDFYLFLDSCEGCLSTIGECILTVQIEKKIAPDIYHDLLPITEQERIHFRSQPWRVEIFVRSSDGIIRYKIHHTTS